MNTPFYNDMCSIVWKAFQNLYPDKQVTCEWTHEIDDTDDGKAVYGMTQDLDGDDEYFIQVVTTIPVEDATEILAHELAHAAVGLDHDHDAEWEKAFDAIFDEYNRIVSSEFIDDQYEIAEIQVVSGKDYAR